MYIVRAYILISLKRRNRDLRKLNLKSNQREITNRAGVSAIYLTRKRREKNTSRYECRRKKYTHNNSVIISKKYYTNSITDRQQERIIVICFKAFAFYHNFVVVIVCVCFSFFPFHIFVLGPNFFFVSFCCSIFSLIMWRHEKMTQNKSMPSERE